MTKKMTEKEMMKLIENYFNKKNTDMLDELKQRWENRKEFAKLPGNEKYKNWSDFENIMKKSFARPELFISGTKRPFGFKFKFNDKVVNLFIKVKGQNMHLSAKYSKS